MLGTFIRKARNRLEVERLPDELFYQVNNVLWKGGFFPRRYEGFIVKEIECDRENPKGYFCQS